MNRCMLTVSMACLFAATGVRADDVRALKELQKAGATVDRDESKPDKPIRLVSVNVRQITGDVNQALKELEELPAIELVGAGATEIPIATLRSLQGKATLRRLSIAYAQIDDECAKVLGALKGLDTLDLRVQVDVSPKGLGEIFKLTNLKELTLSDRLVSDDAIEELTKLTGLKTLNLRSVFVTDGGLASLKRLKGLQTMRISLTNSVTDAGLVHLVGLQLKRLEVTYYNVSDRDLKRLRQASALKVLRLMNAKNITEASIPYLGEMTGLKELEIVGTKLMKDQIKELRAKLPDCKIIEGNQ